MGDLTEFVSFMGVIYAILLEHEVFIKYPRSKARPYPFPLRFKGRVVSKYLHTCRVRNKN